MKENWVGNVKANNSLKHVKFEMSTIFKKRCSVDNFKQMTENFQGCLVLKISYLHMDTTGKGLDSQSTRIRAKPWSTIKH